MKIVILIIIVFSGLVVIISLNYNRVMGIASLGYKKLVIKGDPKFVDQISQALVLLKEKAPEAYDMVNEYAVKIEQSKRSGMAPFKIPPIMFLSDETIYYSLTWCAGAIAHEAFHSKLYHEYKKKHPWRVWQIPPEVWISFEAERKCLKYQLEVLKKINAPIHEINYVASGDGTHGDLNGDGKVDMKDQQLRYW
ncbi:MAG: hypothetical protein GX654_22400 [Desulfatiglans sp.]|jgi:hypothetical protein|nr:hypothetical protein [Desulfatiglans sp.]